MGEAQMLLKNSSHRVRATSPGKMTQLEAP